MNEQVEKELPGFNEVRKKGSAILELVNETDQPGEIDIRVKGEKSYQTYHLEPGARAWAIVRLVEGKFQSKVSNTGCKIYLRGYMAMDAFTK